MVFFSLKNSNKLSKSSTSFGYLKSICSSMKQLLICFPLSIESVIFDAYTTSSISPNILFFSKILNKHCFSTTSSSRHQNIPLEYRIKAIIHFSIHPPSKIISFAFPLNKVLFCLMKSSLWLISKNFGTDIKIWGKMKPRVVF